MLRSGGMHIVHVTCAHEWNDVRIYERMALSMARAGHRVTIVAPHPRSGEPAPSAGVEVVGVERAGSRLCRFTWAARVACRTAVGIPADVYHLHDAELLPWAALSPRIAGRAVFDAHEDLAGSLMSRTWIPAPVRPATARCATLALHTLLPRLAGTIAATPAIGALLPARNLLGIVQNFPDLDDRTPDVAPRRRIAAYVGSLDTARGSAVLWSMAAALGERGIGLEIAGLVAEAPAAVAGCAVPVLHGTLTRQDVDALLARAGVGLVLFQPVPNHVASQPNKLFEYMAAGLPVVASDFPLWRELVIGSGAGLVVDPTDPRAACTAVERILGDARLARTMSESGRAAVRQRFRWATQLEVLLRAYESISNRRSVPRPRS
jgi:glycosyltransferase involved in cell wall biosynthesis